MLGGLGWAGPAQLTGLDSAPNKGWADLGPSGIGPISAQQSLLFSSGPDLGQTAGMGQNQSGPQTHGWARTNLAQRRKKRQCWARISLAQQPNIRGGIIFPLSSCMHNAVRSACREEKNTKAQTIRGEKSYLAWKRWCVAGLAASLEVLRLTGGGSKQ